MWKGRAPGLGELTSPWEGGTEEETRNVERTVRAAKITRGAGSLTLFVPRKWSRPGVVDVRCAVRAAKSCRGAVSLTLSVPRKLVAVRGR